MGNSVVKLAAFDGSGFEKGAGFIKTTLWYFVNALIVRASWNPFMGIKIAMLRLFGAKIGKGLVIKNEVRIKSPWNLVVGDDCWLGEGCWISCSLSVVCMVMRSGVCSRLPISLYCLLILRISALPLLRALLLVPLSSLPWERHGMISIHPMLVRG